MKRLLLLTAYDKAGHGSVPSNEVFAIIDAPPACPQNLKVSF